MVCIVLCSFNIILLGQCSYPHTNRNVSIEGYDNGLENSQIRYYCQSGYVPSETMVADCTNGGV